MWFSKYWDFAKKTGFRAFLGISGCFYGDFRCPRAAEIPIFWLKSQFLREIPKKPRNPDFRENHMGRRRALIGKRLLEFFPDWVLPKNVPCWTDAPPNLRWPSLPSQAYTVGVLVTFFDQAVVVQVKHQTMYDVLVQYLATNIHFSIHRHSSWLLLWLWAWLPSHFR